MSAIRAVLKVEQWNVTTTQLMQHLFSIYYVPLHLIVLYWSWEHRYRFCIDSVHSDGGNSDWFDPETYPSTSGTWRISASAVGWSSWQSQPHRITDKNAKCKPNLQSTEFLTSLALVDVCETA